MTATDAALDNIVQALQDNPNGRLLVAGGKPGLFPQPIRDASRVTFWHSTEHSSRQSSAAVPPRTAAIVFNRWIDHSLTGNLRREARRLNIPMHNVPITPAAIVDLIERAGLTGSATPTISDAPTLPVARGQLREFLRAEADFSKPSQEEIQRLYRLALARGLHTTEASISTSFYQVRKHHRADVAEATPAVVEAPTPAVVEAPTPAVVEAPAPAVPDVLPDFSLIRPDAEPLTPAPVVIEPAAVLAMIDDTIMGLQRLSGDAISALQLVREAVVGIRPTLEEAARLQRKVDKLRAFLSE